MTAPSREQQIAERRAQMPASYRNTYHKAVTGRSLRAAVNAFCLECIGWQRQEVTACTDRGCPLYAVRPYQDSLQNGPEEPFIDTGATNSGTRAAEAGSDKKRQSTRKGDVS